MKQCALREGCIVARIKSFERNEIILGDGHGIANYVYFILSGRCQMIESLRVIVKKHLSKKFYTLYDPYVSVIKQLKIYRYLIFVYPMYLLHLIYRMCDAEPKIDKFLYVQKKNFCSRYGLSKHPKKVFLLAILAIPKVLCIFNVIKEDDNYNDNMHLHHYSKSVNVYNKPS